MRYRLRTLLIVLAIWPPVLAWGWPSGERLFWQYVWPHPDLNKLPPGKTVWLVNENGRWVVADSCDGECGQTEF